MGHFQQLLRDWRERLTADGISFEPGEALLAEMQTVWGASDFVAQRCLRQPLLLPDLQREGVLDNAYTPGGMAEGLARQLDSVTDEAALEQVLRRFRNTQMVRIIWRDILRKAPLSETLEDLSELADVVINQALRLLFDWAIGQSGMPRDAEGKPQELVVLGMGKLGARELNLSSDIDLIFAFPRRGETDGARPLDNEPFFTRLGRKLINVLGRQTADGFVFRVDMRLRPFGDSGPLVMSYTAFENYYESQAREWERYAMIKARVIAGSQAAREEMESILRPFVYRRYIDFGVIESIRDMKQKIQREMHRKGMDANVKLGVGGIREIEFIGQAFQLVRGGRDPELQIRPILQVLQRLGEKGLLPPFAVKELVEAYEFLRLTENRIQAWQDEQTHILFSDEAGQARLARAMGFDDWPAFEKVLAKHRKRVHQHFEQVFAAPQADDENRNACRLAALWSGEEIGGGELLAQLADAGFEAPEQAVEQVVALRDSALCRALPTRGRQQLDRLMPLLLEAVLESGVPDLVLERVLRLLQAIVRRTAYLDLLLENPLALSQLVRLGSESSWIISQLIRHPLLLDELLDPRRLYSPLHRKELDQELDALLSGIDPEDLEQQMERLRQFADGNRLRVAAADIAGVIPLMVVSDYLTEIAEAILDRVARLALEHLWRKHGHPTDILGEESGFAIIGYGKLGGIELGYGSDLDLVFLHGSQGAVAMTDGDKSVANDVFFARLGQRIIHLLTTRTPSGILYETDMRLRPNGNSGMLVSSLNAFERYQQQDAWTWEHQALVRARPVAGDPKVLARFEAVRREILCRERDPGTLRREVVEMRGKMRDSLDKSDAQQFDLKQGVGGIADIEFMVQYAVLRWAHQYPDLAEWSDNIRLLETLARLDLMEGVSAEQLSNAYRVFRAVYHRNTLQETAGLIPDGKLREERQMVADIWQALMLA